MMAVAEQLEREARNMKNPWNIFRCRARKLSETGQAFFTPGFGSRLMNARQCQLALVR